MMMRALLADHFKLAVHSETQQVPVYGLTLAKPSVLGPKLAAHPAKRALRQCSANGGWGAQAPPDFGTASGFPTVHGGILGMPPSTPGLLALGARNVTIDLIAC